MKLLYQFIIKFWFILIFSVGLGQTTGCMDDGYQQWSPNWGSRACNYNDAANLDDGSCEYADCNGVCPAIAVTDNCGECAGGAIDEGVAWCGETSGANCCDCDGIPNGTAYINLLCIDSDNNNGCVGGDTGNADCLIIEIESGVLFESNSVDDTIQVFVTNLDTLKSLDIEFQYNSNVLQIKDKVDEVGTPGFSLGTILESYYEIDYENFVVNEDSMKTIFMLYYEPNTEADSVMYFTNVKENIFNIVLETRDIASDITTQIIINKISINEILMDNSNWVGGEILVVLPTGCTDESACNFDPNAGEDDGSCAYELDCNGACGGPLLNTCIGGGGDDQSTCETAGGYWSVSGYDICEVCAGTDTDSDQCFCTEENIIYDCNGDCPPIEDCPNEFSFTEGCAFQDTNCSDVCVGGATERYPCEQDCVAILLSTEEWGGIAYEDNCGVCISNTVETVIPEVLDSLDCFKSSFSIFNSNGIEINDLIVKESDTIYVVLHMQNLPNSLEGLILNIDYNSNDLFLNNWSVDPEEFNLEGALTGELDNSIELYVDIDSTFIDSTIFTAVIYATNEPYQENGGNILFLEFATLGNNGDSTVLNYNEVQINEHVMKEQNYTSQVFYIGDCNGIFNGDTPPDDCGICGGGNADMDQCGVCFGPGTIYECGCENIPEGTCDCDGNTPADLYGGEGYNCEGEELSINEILIPKSFELSQNYPNPFNPITYIQYSIPHYDFITIDIINISGQIIKTVVQSSHQPGNYEIMWDGTNQYGISVPSGIYFYKLDADEFISVKKLVLLK